MNAKVIMDLKEFEAMKNDLQFYRNAFRKLNQEILNCICVQDELGNSPIPSFDIKELKFVVLKSYMNNSEADLCDEEIENILKNEIVT